MWAATDQLTGNATGEVVKGDSPSHSTCPGSYSDPGSTEEDLLRSQLQGSWGAEQGRTLEAISFPETKNHLENHLSFPSRIWGVNQSKSFVPEGYETQEFLPASDDDDDDVGGVVTTNPSFVRSFNKRIRTREQRGWRCKTLSGSMDVRQPKVGERKEEKERKKNKGGGEGEVVGGGGSWAASHMKNEKDVGVRSTRLSVVHSESETDISDLCSSGPDEVFWPPAPPRRKSHSVFYDSVSSVEDLARSPEREERTDGSRSKTNSTSMKSGNEDWKTCADGSVADGEVSRCLEGSPKTKDLGGGLSFLSRLSKSVSVRRKYGKSHSKSHIFTVNDKKMIEKAMANKENLESILENSLERVSEEVAHSRRCEMEGLTQGWTIDDTANQSTVPQGLEYNPGCDLSSRRDTRRSLRTTPAVGKEITLEAMSGLRHEAASFLKLIKPPPPARANTPSVPVNSQNPTPHSDDGSCSSDEPSDLIKSLDDQRNSSGTDQSSDIIRTVSTAFHSLWPAFFTGSTGCSRPPSDEVVNKTSDAELDCQNDTSLICHPSDSLTVKSGDECADGSRQTSDYSSLPKVPQVLELDTQVPSQCPGSSAFPSLTSSETSHAKPSQEERWKEGTTPKKSKFFHGFVFHTENTTKKSEAEKGPAREKNVKKEKNFANERKPEVKPPQTRLRRVGALKKTDDYHLLLLDDGCVSLTSVITSPQHDTPTSHLQRPSTDSSSSTEKQVSTGAVPKTSCLHKALQDLNRNDAKPKTSIGVKSSERENNPETNGQEGSQGKNGPSRSSKKQRKPPAERSISIPFWTKFHPQENGSVIAATENDDLLGNKEHSDDDKQFILEMDEDFVKAKASAEGSSSPCLVNRKGKSSPCLVNRKGKSTHKRARSQDLTKTLKHDGFSLAPERSASHDNLDRLRRDETLEVSMLSVDFLVPPDSTSETKNSSFPDDLGFDTLGHRSSHKHLSCDDILDIGKDVNASPKLTRTFRDSKFKSASAFCLSAVGTKRSSPTKGRESRVSPAPLGEDSCPSGGSSPPSPTVSGDPAGEGGFLRTRQLLYISPYDLLSDSKDKPYIQRLIGLFHTDSKMDSLVQQLDMYSKAGIPRQPHLLACQTLSGQEEVVLEDSWRKLVEGNEQLDERQEQQQSAIWELVETEATYIHMLKVITDLFLACLCNLQNESLLYEVDTDKLFSNIQEIYNANLSFWRDHVIRMLDASRSTRQPLDPTLLNEAFFKFDELFNPYTRYCLEQSNCQLYCKEKDHDNEYFKMYLAWCETQKECNRLRLVDILVQPMQRLTKYSLLLKAILKKTTLEDHKLCLQEMITHVESFVSNVNSALRHKHEQERLRDIAKRIEAYEAVEARDDELERVVRNYSDLNLTQPMPGCPEHLPRHLLHHGDLRFRDPHTSKMDVHVFLFTDLLLITKVTQRKAEKVKIVRPPYHVERLVLVELKDSTSIGLVSINEWNVAVAAFTLQCPDQRTHRTWFDTLKRAKEQYKEAQQTQDVLVYDDMTCVGHLAPRSPRSGSSRASRVSSLAHSHSGSIDLNEASPATQHHPSIDMSEVRASSASSEDSVALPAPEIQRSRSLEGGGCGAISPRPDRRPGFPKTPNTLSVTPPYATGQSLPNLTVESAHSLRVPGTNGSNPKALSPCNRGVSYPPPSPRTLRRSAPVPQSRNPPLIKTRHVTSMAGSPQEVDQNDQDDPARGGPRRIYRIDRMDNRRYHTAGAIDDIKKQDTKDATIHKRLSWNYGQGPPPSRDLGNDQGKLGRHKHAVKNISCESVHSSSGVSSTSSLHRSMGSEVEALENIDDNEADGEATVVDLTVSDCTSLKISPHISTTYICHDSDITLGVCSQYITQPNSSPEPGEACENLVKIDVSETDPGISSVQITVTEGAASSSSSNLSSTSPSDSAPVKPDNMRMREILLNDASVEASDV